MIEGIFVEVGAEELKALLLKRAEFHRAKAAEHKKRQDLVADVEEVEQDGYSNQTARGVKATLKESAAMHERRANYFSFLAEHLVPEVYRLGEVDLTKLEFFDRFGF